MQLCVCILFVLIVLGTAFNALWGLVYFFNLFIHNTSYNITIIQLGAQNKLSSEWVSKEDKKAYRWGHGL